MRVFRCSKKDERGFDISLSRAILQHFEVCNLIPELFEKSAMDPAAEIKSYFLDGYTGAGICNGTLACRDFEYAIKDDGVDWILIPLMEDAQDIQEQLL